MFEVDVAGQVSLIFVPGLIEVPLVPDVFAQGVGNLRVLNYGAGSRSAVPCKDEEEISTPTKVLQGRHSVVGCQGSELGRHRPSR